MKKLKVFVFFLYVINIASYAAEKITVELSSDKITLEEEVNAVIRVETDADIEPKVSAEGSNAEIVASEYQGATTSTIYMNGQLSSKREHLFVVLLKAKGYGRAGLINISADIGGRVLRHDSVWFSVVTEKTAIKKRSTVESR